MNEINYYYIVTIITSIEPVFIDMAAVPESSPTSTRTWPQKTPVAIVDTRCLADYTS